MQRQDVALGLSAGANYTKFTLTSADLTAAATTQTINLLQNPPSPGAVTVTPAANFVIPQGGVMLGVRIKHSTAFAGTAITAMTVSVGCATSGAAFFASAFDVFQAVGDTVLQESSMFKSGQLSSNPVTVKFTATGANVNAATAGSVDIYLFYMDVSTSSTPGTTPGASGGGSGV